MLTISNQTQSVLKFVNDWFGSGKVAEGDSWQDVQPGQDFKIRIEEKDYSMAGSSGYVVFSHPKLNYFVFAYSNPDFPGTNKVGAGQMDQNSQEKAYEIWDDMTSHD